VSTDETSRTPTTSSISGFEHAAVPEHGDAGALLARTRRLVDPALRAAVGSLPASLCRVASYHLGWQDADGTPSRADGGKAIRPALVLAACEALGGSAERAVPAAVAVELVHNFTLLHDDVIDRDTTRRHRATAWSVFGVADAIVTGDALAALAQTVLDEGPAAVARRAAPRLGGCVIELCDGQQADCAFERRDDVRLDECLAMAEAKTGALLGCACALGAIYADADDTSADALDAFGRQIGLAFQLIDDMIGIWGDTAVTGKPVGADLAARKKSLPVVAALRAESPAAFELRELYRAGRPLRAAEVCRAADAVERAGGRGWAQAEAAERMAGAVTHLSAVMPEPDAAGDLLALAHLATRRNH
jgi:geranylgeranyl diphosphate synthase type I